MASTINQISAITAMNLRTIPARLGASLVIVVGIGGVVGVLVALLAMGEGFKATLASTGRADRAIVLRGGSTDELGSVVMRDQALIIADAPGVKKGADGKPMALFEQYMLTDVAKQGDTTPNNLVVRGTSADVLGVRSEVKIVEGRMFKPGVREVVVGRGAQRQFAGLSIGSSVEVRDGGWQVVGVFDSGGDVHESEIWVDEGALSTAGRRGGAFNTVAVQLESTQAFQKFKDALTSDPRLTVNVQREPEYYASRSEQLNDFITILGYSVAVIMAIGAVFGALNTMYVAVSTRAVEIATLRAIGFGGLPVVISVLAESMLLALAGGALGAGIAYVIFNGYSVATLNMQTFSQVAFAFRVTPELLQNGLILALLLGLVGGLFPAVRAARLPIVDALRAA
jgi:putative ABC transport system permease protein